ncbi:MAG: TetR/AcrR family transcriptional regulator [Steroidobacteraceae bacterium]
MVHKGERRPRGRPRAYEPTRALAQATGAFWQVGYSGTSLDQLSDATDMNRPSLYAAFGDKHSLYLQTLERYIQNANSTIAVALDRALPLVEGLRRFYAAALATYLPSGAGARGCYLIGTALTEAPGDTEVRAKVLGALRQFDRALLLRLQYAVEQGELSAAADPKALAMMASAVLHTLAIRSRAGESRAALQSIVDTAIGVMAGGGGRKKSRAR